MEGFSLAREAHGGPAEETAAAPSLFECHNQLEMDELLRPSIAHLLSVRMGSLRSRKALIHVRVQPCGIQSGGYWY